MAIFNIFSKRQQLLRAQPSDILIYDNMDSVFRTQIVHIIRDAFGQGYSSYTSASEVAYQIVHDILCLEYGIFVLFDSESYMSRMFNFILTTSDVERVLDAIERSFHYIDFNIRNDYGYQHSCGIALNADGAIDELNMRFKEHALGFRYEAGEIIRLDSTYIHSEVVKPSLLLLHNKRFSGANEEYLKAHDHYRHGRNKECLAECLKAFESTMKIICVDKGWNVPPTATANGLINAVITNGLVPQYIQSQMTALRSAMETGVPTLRNRIGGHGQGTDVITADDTTARYVLNLTGSNIIYLAELSNL